jgi:drug/metabolite transporter (DMT)-like permease
MTQPKASPGLSPYLLVALAALLWAGNHILGRAIAGHVPPLAISTIRWAVPALLLAPFAIPHLARDWPLIRRHRLLLLFLALTGTSVFGVLQYVSLQYTTALNMGVLNSFAPVLMAAAGAVLFRDRLGPVAALGIATSLAGVMLIVTRGEPATVAQLSFNRGDLIIVFNMTLWGIYSACLRLRPRIHWLSFTFVLAAVSALSTLPFFIAEHLSGDTLQPTLKTAAALAYASIFPSLVAVVAWNRGVELIGSNRAGAMLHLVALFGATLATVLLGERLEAFHLAGFTLIIAGVWMAARQQ